MTYIQDKLDEIENDLKEKGYTKYERETAIYIVKQSLTDYHNHIVEKIEMLKRKHYNETEFMNHRNDYNDAHNEALQSVISLLQDTNLTNS